MSRIHIVREHKGDKAEARAAIEEAARHIAAAWGIDYTWEGDHIHFSRAGVDGTMRIGEADVEIEARLGFFVAMLRQPIENEINKELDRHFA